MLFNYVCIYLILNMFFWIVDYSSMFFFCMKNTMHLLQEIQKIKNVKDSLSYSHNSLWTLWDVLPTTYLV